MSFNIRLEWRSNCFAQHFSLQLRGYLNVMRCKNVFENGKLNPVIGHVCTRFVGISHWKCFPPFYFASIFKFVYYIRRISHRSNICQLIEYALFMQIVLDVWCNRQQVIILSLFLRYFFVSDTFITYLIRKYFEMKVLYIWCIIDVHFSMYKLVKCSLG